MFRKATLPDKDLRAFDHFGRPIGRITDTKHHSAGILHPEETAAQMGSGVKYQCTKCKRWIDAAGFDAHVRSCTG